MKKNEKIKKILEKYNSLCPTIKVYTDLIGETRLNNLEKDINEFSTEAQQDLNESRLLKIGVIGQIKRGKSSFLNALIFDGKDILPKAATPMTAALTKIQYSDTPKAIIEYYTKSEWEEITKDALEFKKRVKFNQELKKSLFEGRVKSKQELKKFLFEAGKEFLKKEDKEQEKAKEITDKLKVANELYEMAKDLNVSEYLSKGNTEINGSKVEELIKKLDNYVGAKGKFTPIVKSTQLQLNIEALKNIEIVDTPGMNDPIMSRGARTREFMGEMDVVFFLSSLSQFLDASDMEVLTLNLPNKGIKNISLIGTMFDNLLYEEGDKYDNFQSALSSLIARKMQEKKERARHITNPELRKKLTEEDLICISSIWYNIAKHFNNLSEDEQFYFNKLKEFPEINFNSDIMLQLSQIEKAKVKLNETKLKKEEIIEQRFDNRVVSFKRNIREKLSLIKDFSESQEEKLRTGNINELKKQLELNIKAIKKGKIKVSDLFEGYLIEIEKKFADLRSEVERAKSKGEQLKVESFTKSHRHTRSTSKWYNPFSWWDTETYYTYTNHSSASVYEAIENLENYVQNSKDEIRNQMKTLIDIKKFKRDLINNIEDMFDFADDDFDVNDILLPVKNAVNRITIPNVEINVDKYIDKIKNNFSSTVQDSEISKLKDEQRRVAKEIEKEILKEVQNILNRIIDKLENIKVNFIPEITKDLKESSQKIEEQLKNKEKNLEKYEKLIDLLEKHLMDL